MNWFYDGALSLSLLFRAVLCCCEVVAKGLVDKGEGGETNS